jgi:hypothetical protein
VNKDITPFFLSDETITFLFTEPFYRSLSQNTDLLYQLDCRYQSRR